MPETLEPQRHIKQIKKEIKLLTRKDTKMKKMLK
jgi:hypothetical protein